MFQLKSFDDFLFWHLPFSVGKSTMRKLLSIILVASKCEKCIFQFSHGISFVLLSKLCEVTQRNSCDPGNTINLLTEEKK